MKFCSTALSSHIQHALNQPCRHQDPSKSRRQHTLGNRRITQGFSLLELAIALAVIAVLSGGILKGREMIKSAKVQSTITDLNALETALANFEGRYAALPGDFSNASNAGLGSSTGNSNGLIDSAAEIGSVFSQLAKAKFIQGTFTASDFEGEQCPSTACMSTPFGGTYQISHSIAGPNTPTNALSIYLGASTPASQLAELDRKLDDGNPLQGSIQVEDTDSSTCTTESGAWNESENPNCGAVYLLK